MLVLTAACSTAADTATAIADRATFPPEQQSQLRYVSTEAALTELEREHQEIALKLILPSVSRQENLDYCKPVQVSPTLWRIDLAALKWSPAAWLRAVADYPYHPTGYFNPLVVEAHWLLPRLTDQTESTAYLELIFGVVPATRDEALGLLHVDNNPELRFGLIEGNSGVSVQKVRWIENRPISRGYAWGTRDSLQINAAKDPLERPDGGFQHDGEEWIIGLPKFDPNTGYRGALQAYFLANGQGTIVPRAPVDLVEDHTKFRGFAEVRNPGSCIQCHSSRLNVPGENEFRLVREIGVEFKALVPLDEKLAAFHLSDLKKELTRNNEDCDNVIRLITGVSPEEASLAFSSVVSVHDADVTFERAAAEYQSDPWELALAIDYALSNNLIVGTRFAALARGRELPREAFEERYQTVYQILQTWRNL